MALNDMKEAFEFYEAKDHDLSTEIRALRPADC
jgi:hypothetical protein